MFKSLFSSPLPPIITGIGVIILVVVVLYMLFQRNSREKSNLRQMIGVIERKILHLAGNASVAAEDDERDLLTIIASLSSMLDILLERQQVARQKEQREAKQARLYTAQVIQKPARPQEPSATAQALMSLRDRMLLARPKDGEPVISTEVLDVFYQELGEILAKEQVISLEEVGDPYDQERQMVVDTQVTGDPGQHNVVYRTENPGYLFQDRLLRPQEVVIYKFQPSSVVS